MGNVTKSQAQNILSPNGNSLAVYIDGVSGIISLKDVQGNTEPLSNYIALGDTSPFEYNANNSGIQPKLNSNNALGNNSFIGGGEFNSSCGTNSIVVGGYCNTSQATSFIGGGEYNYGGGNFSSVINGYCNSASANDSVIIGGTCNTSSSIFSFVGNGVGNIAQAEQSFIGNGCNNFADGVFSFIGNGQNNCITSSYSSIVSSTGSCVTGSYSSIVSGQGNYNYGDLSFIGGGYRNIIDGRCSSIVGGTSNKTCGDLSSILGGSGAITLRYGEIAKASGFINREGDVQQIDLTAFANAPSGGTANLALDGDSISFNIPDGYVVFLTIKTFGYDFVSGKSSSYFDYIVIRNLGGASIIYQNNIMKYTYVGYTVVLSLAGSNLRIIGNSPPTNAMKWIAHLSGVQIQQ